MSNSVTDDSRWGKVIAWIAGVGGSLTVIMLAWIGTTMVDVKVGIAEQSRDTQALRSDISFMKNQLDRQEQRVSGIDNRLTGMEARQIRQVQ